MKRLTAMQWLLGITTGLLAGQCIAAEKAAQLDWYQHLLLSTPVSGVIEQVYVAAGQPVKSGQRLIKMDNRGFRAQVSKAEGVLSRATETHAEAKREMERAQELFDRTAISVHERELVKIAYTKAIAGLKEAQADLTAAKLDLEYSELRAPVAGVVLQVFAYKGQTVINQLQASPLLAMAATNKMLARALLDGKELDGLQTGMDVDIRVQGQALTGKIHRLGLEPANTEQPPMYVLEVVFDPGDKVYRKGQQASIILP